MKRKAASNERPGSSKRSYTQGSRTVSRYSSRAPPATRGFYGNTWGDKLRSKSERKVVDVATANYACDSTGSVTYLAPIAVGTDYTDRIGRKINIRSIQARGFVFPEDQTSGGSIVRVMCVYDAQSNGAAIATITDILQQSSPLAPLNLANRDRFKVIWDKQFALGQVSNVATQSFAGSPTNHQFKKYKRCNLPVIYNTTTNTIAAVSSGAILLLTLGNNAAGTGATLAFNSRIRFEDA